MHNAFQTPYNHKWCNEKFAFSGGIVKPLNAEENKLVGAFLIILFSEVTSSTKRVPACVIIMCAMFMVAAELGRCVMRKSKGESSYLLTTNISPLLFIGVSYLIWPLTSIKS